MDPKLFYTNWLKPIVGFIVGGFFVWLAVREPEIFALLQAQGIDPAWLAGFIGAVLGLISVLVNRLAGKHYKQVTPAVDHKGEDPELVK